VCDSGKRVTEQFKQEIDLTARRNTAMAQLVRDLMTSDPVALPADTPVRQAAQAMREHDIGDVLVVDNGELRGIVTDRDIVIRGLADWEDVSTCSLGDVCSDQLLTATPNDDIDTAIERDPDSALAEISVDEGNT
jgi:CBS domain-containing protein